MNANLAADLLRFAKLDLAIAQRDSKRADRKGEGMMMVTKTKIGLVIAGYVAATKTYSLSNEGNVLVQGRLGDVAKHLAGLYVVVPA